MLLSDIKVVSWLNPQILEESLWPVVHDQFVREFRLGQQGAQALVVGYLEGDVGIAAENRGDIVLLAEAQDFEVVVAGHGLMTLGSQRVIVHLQQRVRLLGGQYQRLEVEFRRAVARMADNMNLGISDGVDYALRVLLYSPTLPANDVDACDADVEAVEVFVVEVKMAISVEDVHFAAHQQPDAVHAAWHDEHVLEIEQSAGAGYAGAVLRDAKHLQTLVGSSLCHLLYRAVAVTRGYGVGVYV